MSREPRTPSRSEHGYSVLELVVVISIIAVLLTIGTIGRAGAERSGMNRQMRSLARAYHEALSQYANDNGGQTPAVNNARGWPRDSLIGRGPIDRMQPDINARYIKTVPESIANESVCLAIQDANNRTLNSRSRGCSGHRAVVSINMNQFGWTVTARWKQRTVVCVIDSAGSSDQSRRC